MSRASQVESLWNGILDTNGQPLAAGKVYSYDAGTTNPRTLYSALDKSASHTNPLILDSNGKALAFADGAYKFIIKTSADATLYTHDNLYYLAADSSYTSFSPTLTCSGSMTITGTTISHASYAQIAPKSVHLLLHVTGTLVTPASTSVYVPLPVAPAASLNQDVGYFYGEAGAVLSTVGIVRFNGASTRAELNHAVLSDNFALGVWGAIVNCVYRID